MKSQLRYLKVGSVRQFEENEKFVFEIVCREEPEMKLYKNIYPIWLL